MTLTQFLRLRTTTLFVKSSTRRWSEPVRRMRGLVRPADVSQCFSLHSARHQQSRPSLPTHAHYVFSFLIGSECSGSATFSACCVDSDIIQELGLVIWRPSLCFGAGHETWRSGVVNSSACTFQHQYRVDSSQTDQTELFRRLACFGFDSRCCYIEKNLFFCSGSDSSGGNPKRRGFSFVCLGGKKKKSCVSVEKEVKASSFSSSLFRISFFCRGSTN
ncbi:hypothetical protein ILYODFUR_026791 [Ilyodon furcidens]|uniref:Uncharacterized protein n=1 Tax=Ilyodon furcidens TaxID=33524 RepID=A0ABV0UAM6_9TELE